MKIGIIAAFHPETKVLKKHLNFKAIQENVFQSEDKRMVLLETGVGKDNVEKKLPPFLDCFSFDAVINIGSSGALDRSIDLYDVVLPQQIITPAQQFLSDSPLTKNIMDVLHRAGISCQQKTLLTWEGAILSTPLRKMISQKFSAAAVDMEAGFLLPFLLEKEVPWAIIKVISDTPGLPDFKRHIGKTAVKIRDIITLLAHQWQ